MADTKETIKYIFKIAPDGCVSPAALTKGNAVAEIPPGVYTLQCHPEEGFYLKPEDNFKMPKRVYGEVGTHVDRFLRSYELNDKNLGVLLVGDAGSGKTLTLKALVTKATDMGMPTIMVNAPYTGDGFVAFLATITQNCLVCFDEFDKVYASQNEHGQSFISAAQHTILQLLDGASSAPKKLFGFSANDESMISPYMRNRPSRIRYTVKFSRLELPVVVDYVTANLKHFTEDHLHAFIHLALADGVRTFEEGVGSDGMNFDTMREMVTEMNQFDDDLNGILELMSSRGSKSSANFEVTVFENDKRIFQTVAQSTHEGAYPNLDNSKINMAMHSPSKDNPDQLNYELVELTTDNFHAFGDNHDTLEYRKDGRVYMCRYLRYNDFQKLGSSISSNIQKSQMSAQSVQTQIPSWQSQQSSDRVLSAKHAEQSMKDLYGSNSARSNHRDVRPGSFGGPR